MVYMNVPAVRSEVDESFEERRVKDYIQAYIATGKPPAPCPQVPTDPRQRAALGLPPLFDPYTEVEGGVNGIATTSGTPAAALNFSAQAFSPVKTQEYGSDTVFHSIVAQPEYSKHSFEELRVEAYRLGKKYADVPTVPVAPPAQAQRPGLLPSISLSGSSSSRPDSLQSINSMPPYDQHSFEELRLAFIKAGRPLTSPEIVSQNAILRLTV
ncbi:hypothetical protein L226DRAFT_472512 [Lentinus tigrinus ALCF2SS1-7]|uniref:Uncharacterized protein n=1 Tax=Lentinus tigrinus ALCF2SS1-6 TaxID=1328759 RepID=A0A5C2S328_9APHY|nr:hypothetical protein L227DRAFT_505860 [Lentinus tigrinus ALCF2SS1-6]RPD69026.1 hypothetical protein L226DRAFT_472512 [Lentinus tigrinus ALCF2SS1-7]